MEDLGKRAALTYGVLSVGVWLLKSLMQSAGHDSAHNPAWNLILGLFTLFKWSWWIILIGAGILLVIFVINRIVEYFVNQKRQQLEAEKRRAKMILENNRKAEKVQRVKEEEVIRVQIQKAKPVETQIEEEPVAIQDRTPKKVVELALIDFCKGGS